MLKVKPVQLEKNVRNNTYTDGALVYTITSTNTSNNGSTIQTTSVPVAIPTGTSTISLGSGQLKNCCPPLINVFANVNAEKLKKYIKLIYGQEPQQVVVIVQEFSLIKNMVC